MCFLILRKKKDPSKTTKPSTRRIQYPNRRDCNTLMFKKIVAINDITHTNLMVELAHTDCTNEILVSLFVLYKIMFHPFKKENN